MRGIHQRAGDRALTPGETERWDRLEAGRTTALREAEEAEGEMRQTAHGFVARGGGLPGDGNVDPAGPRSPELMRRVDPWDGDSVRSLTPQQARDKALAVLERGQPALPSRSVDQVERLVRSTLTMHTQCDGTEIARRMLLTENDAYRSAFMQMVTIRTRSSPTKRLAPCAPSCSSARCPGASTAREAWAYPC
ncbi:hypothetical protein ACQP2K_30650 [Microbispora siamensis]